MKSLKGRGSLLKGFTEHVMNCRKAAGTLISRNRDMSDVLMTSIVLKTDVTLMDIVSTRMLGQFGFLAKVTTETHLVALGSHLRYTKSCHAPYSANVRLMCMALMYTENKVCRVWQMLLWPSTRSHAGL